MIWLVIIGIVVVILALVTIYDLTQKKHAILRNFPIIGHLRYALEFVGPELRQYIVTDNDEERPFNRDQRRWVYASAKEQNPYFGFGTDSKLDSPQHVLIRQAGFPYRGDGSEIAGGATGTASHELASLKVMGEFRNRPGAFRPASIVNISAMSFGSLSGPAVQALNRGSAASGCLHNTGEGGISAHHRHGGELIFQLGTGYFGARGPDGQFSMDAMLASMQGAPVKAIEVKLSQGAKPGLGGVLPGDKVTAEISEARGVPIGQTVESPAYHKEFSDVRGLINFVERIADASGVPVGIKAAVGQIDFWNELAEAMKSSGKGPDFISIDGGEGGTGAAPLVFSDHVSLPFRAGFAEVFTVFAQHGIQHNVTWIGAGKLGFPGEALVAMALGCDLIYVAREAMLAVGCIQAQKCHSGHCPTGVATQNKRLIRGLDPTDKADRTANYVAALRYEMKRVSHACGVAHPGLVPGHAIELLEQGVTTTAIWDRFHYDPAWHYSNSPALRAQIAGSQ